MKKEEIERIMNQTRERMYYNRKGEAIDLEQYAKLFANEKYQVVARDLLDGYLVSTVWLGINHNFRSLVFNNDPGKPIIFETMIFNGHDEVYCDRYCTEEQALEGHKKAVDLVNSGEFDEKRD